MDVRVLVLALIVAVSALGLLVVNDREDTLIRAVRTFVQSALGLLVTVALSDVDADWILNVVGPAVVSAATVVHAAVQPAER